MTAEFILASNLILLVFIPLGIFHYTAGQLLLKEISSKVNFMSLLDQIKVFTINQLLNCQAKVYLILITIFTDNYISSIEIHVMKIVLSQRTLGPTQIKRLIKVSKSRKQIMMSLILPRIRDFIICFRDLLTFSNSLYEF